jgi:uncharacterized protein (UPF0218 family)
VTDVVVRLPESLRDELKKPAGPLYTETASLLDDVGAPLVTVGDVVTAHVLDAGVVPAVALVDDHTRRTAVDDSVAERVAAANFDHETAVSNPAATLTAELLSGLREALARDGTTLVTVDGEEDLTALPAVVVTPRDGGVVYGQPGDGMVLVTVDETARTRMRNLLARMDGNTDRLFAELDE